MSIVIVNFRAVIQQMESRDHGFDVKSFLKLHFNAAQMERGMRCRHKENIGIVFIFPDHRNLS